MVDYLDFPIYQSCDIDYKLLDLKDTSSAAKLPLCQFAIMSDMLYYKDMARVCARRAFELMVSGAEVLVTDPGREVRKEFVDELKEISGAKSKIPTSISKESLVCDR